MAPKLIDFQCRKCQSVSEELIILREGDRRPKQRIAYCMPCNEETEQDAIMGLPAPYMGEKVCNPEMYGGECDTMGFKPMPDLPDLPGAEEHAEKVRQRMRKIPDNAPKHVKEAALNEAARDAPSSADYARLFETKEYKDAEKQRERIAKENKAKRKRAKAILSGENVNMKRDKCAGDPAI